jgi:acyl dehydratase
MTGRRYAEDLTVGETIHFGQYELSRAELITFARKWDPQDFHVDEAIAATGRFGDVIASGIHTLAVFQRLSVLSAERDWAIIAGIRLIEVRFPRPVRPDTVLTGGVRLASISHEHDRHRARIVKAGWLSDDAGRVLELEAEAYIAGRSFSPPGPPG